LALAEHRRRPFDELAPGELIEDAEGILAVDPRNSRVLRGGGFVYYPVNLRSALRFGSLPSLRDGNVGFRVARTLP
jgi:formylglycine-generating enzyme required for sulfatase activity